MIVWFLFYEIDLLTFIFDIVLSLTAFKTQLVANIYTNCKKQLVAK